MPEKHSYTAAPPGDKRTPFFSLKKIVLTFISIVFIFSLSQLKRYHEWQLKLSEYWQAFVWQKEDLSVEKRMEFYAGSGYNECMEIKKHISAAHLTDAVILFPPDDYFKKERIDFHPPEPTVFYYLTGISSIPFRSPDMAKATHFVYITKEELRMTRIRSPRHLAEIRAYFQKYDHI